VLQIAAPYKNKTMERKLYLYFKIKETIMATIDLRNTVKEYIKTADVRLLKMMKALAESYQNDEQELILSKEQYELIDKRREAHLKGETKSFTWEQVKQNARNAAQ
jgi:putative addiction module component (TIGR02574 family)